jgi:hypothetical protein
MKEVLIQSIYEERTGLMCPACRRSLLGDHGWDIHDYSFKPAPKMKGDHSDPLKLGIELEMEILSDRTEETVITKKLYDVDGARGLFYFKHDGSLRHGFELVTEPCTIKYLYSNKQIFDSVLDKAVNLGCRSYDTETCGLHVHMSKAAFKSLHLYKFMKMFYDHPAFILKISQRKADNIERWAQVEHLDEKAIRRSAKSKSSVTGKRHSAVNLCSRNTVEVRIFRGTLNKNSFWKDIQVVHSLFYFTKDTVLRKITLDEYFKFVSKNREDYQELFAFLKNLEFYGAKEKVSKSVEKETFTTDLMPR